MANPEIEKAPIRRSAGGYKLLDSEERQILKDLVSAIQKPKYWKEKRLFRAL